MKTTNSLFCKTLLALSLSVGITGAAHAAPAQSSLAVITLPNILAPIDIGPQRYDQGLVYSSALLDQQQSAGWYPGNNSKFDFAVGSGALGVITYSHNAPANPAGFAPAVEAGTGAGQSAPDVSATWGMGTAGTVGLLRSLLTVDGINYQPLMVFDHNEQSTLMVSGRLAIYRGNAQIASYALDSNPNGQYDPTAYITSCPDVNIGAAVTSTADGCNIQANVGPYGWGTQGSGKPDYFALIDAFDLYSLNYSNSDSFVIEFALKDMDPGFEELGIAGYRFAAYDVPEPGSIALLGLGLLGLAASRRKRKI